jgi:hypothetical protein
MQRKVIIFIRTFTHGLEIVNEIMIITISV